MIAKRFLASLALAASMLAPISASAYCRSSACGPHKEGAICTPALDTDCGIELYWVERCMGFGVQKEASKQVDFATASRIESAAFATWSAASCEGGPPSVRVIDLGAVDCGNVEYNQHSGNANVVVFRDDKWPTREDDVDTLARTTVWFDPDTGRINDADTEVNTANFTFATDGKTAPDFAGEPYDLQAVLTHEAGHFLGLAHSPDPTATMYKYYSGLHERALADDDVTAICAAFPPDRETQDKCTYLPEHGFASECAQDQREGDCSVGSDDSPAAFTFVVAALAALASRRRRRPSS